MAPDATRPYHHGDLRELLLSSALATITADGVGAVSLRRLARDAGVSPGAPYHHFPDRGALFAAVIVEGHALLLTRLTAARGAARDPVEVIREILVAYVAFAADHPAHIRVMLRPELGDPLRHPEVTAAGVDPVELLRSSVVDAQRVDALPPGDPEPLLHLFWSLAVGFVTLWVDGPIETRCRVLGTTPLELMATVAHAVENLLRRPSGDTRAPVGH
ncbi:MAG: TetR/AcrR family transcriptional regulator [Pseudolysinimonas sp.]